MSIPMVSCCGQKSCYRCRGRKEIPCPDALTVYAKGQACKVSQPVLGRNNKTVDADDLLERAYAFDECKTAQEAGDVLGLSKTAITHSLYIGMVKRGFKPINGGVIELRKHIKRFIAALEVETQQAGRLREGEAG